MIKSMTGYGKGEIAAGDRKMTVEIRSLNSKQMDLSLKVPSIYRHVEHEIRGIVSKSLVRGKADVYVCYESSLSAAAAPINDGLFKLYFDKIAGLSAANGIEWGGEVAAAVIPAILRLPDVVSMETREVSDEETEALLKAVRMAVNHLEQFRRQEGETLMRDLLERVSIIEKMMEQITPYETARIENIRRRIVDSIRSLDVPMDSNRLEQELIFYVEKLDITEEKTRLSNHCKYFREVASEEQENGRKLGFIAQEMGREINTIGSKANDAGIQRLVVKMKDELEKIKEQSLNIL